MGTRRTTPACTAARVVAVLLAAMLLAGFVPSAAYATDTGGQNPATDTGGQTPVSDIAGDTLAGQGFDLQSIGDTVTVDGIAYNILTMPSGDTHGTVEVGNNQSYTGTTLSLPSEIEVLGSVGNDGTYDVTAIGLDAFLGCTGITGTLTIPQGVTVIGDGAFLGCTGITGTLIIPSSVTLIDNFAFRFCTGITGTLTIPQGVTFIGDSAFSGTGITGTLTIPQGVTFIGESAFLRTGITALDLSAFTGPLGGGEFSGCDKLVSVRLNGTAAISQTMFFGCTSLSTLVFVGGTSAPTVGNNAFHNVPNDSTRNLYYPAGATGYEDSVFAGGALGAWTRIASTAPTITTTSLSDAVVGTSYSQTLTASGTTPITWIVSAGTLPVGLTLSSDGTISGIPTAAATSQSFTVKATNSWGDNTATVSITVHAAAAPSSQTQVSNTSTAPLAKVGDATAVPLAAAALPVSLAVLAAAMIRIRSKNTRR